VYVAVLVRRGGVFRVFEDEELEFQEVVSFNKEVSLATVAGVRSMTMK